jgi:NodT family efflux transporter outer membrane factor (OMF) lipoprotein
MNKRRRQNTRGRRLQRSFTAAAAALLLAGCGSLAPPHERPALPTPAVFPGPAGSGTAVAADTGWHTVFTDAGLRTLIEAALQNNRDLRIAVLNIEQARAQYQVRRADALPTVNAAAAASLLSRATASNPNLHSAGVAVTAYELDFFGRIHDLAEAAQAQVLATEEARNTVQIGLVAAVASAWLNLLADDEQLALTKQTLRTREESLALTKLRFEHGAASALDWQQARSLVEAARVAAVQLQRQRAIDENSLAQLVGDAAGPGPVGSTALAGLTLGPELAAGLPSDLLNQRPDIRQAEQQLMAANANIGAARAAFFPRITLTGTAGSVSTELSGLFKPGSFGWTFAPQIVLPIFDAGRNRANLEIAQAAQSIAVAQYEKAVQTAFREVADALAGRRTWGEQLRAQQTQAEAEAERARLTDLRYRNGAASYLEVLDAQRSLFAAQQAALQTQLARLQNQLALYKVLGGGWTPPAAATR